MRKLSALIGALFFIGCGGSVTQSETTGGAGGAAGAGAGAGSGGAAGAGSYGGAAGFGGSMGGAAGFAGAGGYAGEFCCKDDTDCGTNPSPPNGPPQLPLQCVAGVCREKPPPMKCWQDGDCPYGMCIGASACPCGADCMADQLGSCMAPTDYCCKTDNDCGDYAYSPCVSGVCKQPVIGHCWKTEECPAGQKCVGVSVCPCPYECGMLESPGQCL